MGLAPVGVTIDSSLLILCEAECATGVSEWLLGLQEMSGEQIWKGTHIRKDDESRCRKRGICSTRVENSVKANNKVSFDY